MDKHPIKRGTKPTTSSGINPMPGIGLLQPFRPTGGYGFQQAGDSVENFALPWPDHDSKAGFWFAYPYKSGRAPLSPLSTAQLLTITRLLKILF